MVDKNASTKFVQALTALAQTQAVLERLPPQFLVATGHEDEVFIFLLRVRDADATMRIMMPVIRLSQATLIAEALAATGGLIKKRFHIDDAYRLKDELEAVGTRIEFIRPDEVRD